jgi:hypothetical protein
MATDITYQSNIFVQGDYIQDIILYPKNGYYISSDGINNFWGNSITLSSANEILFIKHQKIYIPNNYYIERGYLKIYISDYYGTLDEVDLNIYTIDISVDENSTWGDISTSTKTLVGTKKISKNDKNSYISINIQDYVSDYIYGDSAANGLIIELDSISGTVFIEMIGLYCWDETDGEKQNPVIEVTYDYVPPAYLENINVSSAITEDSYISNNNAPKNYNNKTILCEKAEIGGDTKKIFVKFNLGDIPSGSDILRALIHIPRNTDDNLREHREILRRVYQDWDEEFISWIIADDGIAWNNPGGYYDNNDLYDSYNFVVEPNLYTYDVTKIMQVAFESFSLITEEDFYGIVIKGQDLKFNSKEYDDSAYMFVEYLATSLNQPPQAPTLETPSSGTYVDNQPEFIAIINRDNAYGTTEGDDLHFRLEIDDNDSFSSPMSFSTSDSITGWHWSALGDFSDDSTTFPISAGSYTPGTSKIKFDMSETTIFLEEKIWYWRIITIDNV